MENPSLTPTVSTDLARLLLLATCSEANLKALLTAAGIPAELLNTTQARIPAPHFHRLWQELELAAGDSEFGLHLGELSPMAPGGHVLFAAMWNSPTVGQALERFCRYHGIMADVVLPRLTRLSDGKAILGVLPSRPWVLLHRQHVECIFSMVMGLLGRLAGGPVAGEVRFRHHSPAHTGEHRRIFGPGVAFGQPSDELVLSRELLERPIALADPEFLCVLDQHAERVTRRAVQDKPWSAKVARQVAGALSAGRPGLARVARQLGISPRALQGRLREEGTTFQAVLDAVRRDMAMHFLEQTNVDLGELAFMMGFSDQSSFCHAFRRWTGRNPQAVRLARLEETPQR